jgi:hypothetical protein
MVMVDIILEKLWEKEIDKYNQVIEENRATGELDHPDSTIISLKNVSHIIRKCMVGRR